MSIELHEEAGGKILILTLSGKLTKEDYTHFTPVVEQAIKDNGKLRVLVKLHNFQGWTMGALWDDIKFDIRHFADIERLALIGDKKWEAGMALFCKPFTTAAVRFFDINKTEEASTWIHEGLNHAVVTPA